MPVLGSRGGRSAAAFGLGNGGITPQALALFARMTTPPSQVRKIQINKLYTDLIAAGLLSKMDALYVFAAADSQAALLNWIASNSASVNNTPLFTADRGYEGNGGAGYLTGLTAASASTNNHHFSVWMRVAPSSLGTAIALNGSASSGFLRVNAGNPAQLQASSADAGTTSNFTRAPGYMGVSRSNSSDYVRRNGSANTTVSTASVSFSSGAATAILNSGSGIDVYDGQVSIAHYGPALTGTELAAAESAFSTYLTSVGAI